LKKRKEKPNSLATGDIGESWGLSKRKSNLGKAGTERTKNARIQVERLWEE